MEKTMNSSLENGQQELTLAQRLRNVFDQIETGGDERVVSNSPTHHFPITDQHYCVVCKSIRLDLDPTGVTCGSARCLALLGEKILSIDDITGHVDFLEQK